MISQAAAVRAVAESHYQKYGRKCYEKHRERYLEKQREYYQETGKGLKKAAYPERWGQEIFKRYGITKEEYQDMLKEQSGKCRICDSLPKEGKRLDVDHCHSTQNVRGLLCNNCNRGLGHFKDSPVLLVEALRYLLFSGKASINGDTNIVLIQKLCDITGHGGSCGV